MNSAPKPMRHTNRAMTAGVFTHPAVVHDEVHVQDLGQLAVELPKEPHEPPLPMLLKATMDALSRGHLQGRELRGGTWFRRNRGRARSSARTRNLAAKPTTIARGRVHAEPGRVPNQFEERGSRRELDALVPVGRRAERLQDPSDRGVAQTELPPSEARVPVRLAPPRPREGTGDGLFDLNTRVPQRGTSQCLVEQHLECDGHRISRAPSTPSVRARPTERRRPAAPASAVSESTLARSAVCGHVLGRPAKCIDFSLCRAPPPATRAGGRPRPSKQPEGPTITSSA